MKGPLAQRFTADGTGNGLLAAACLVLTLGIGVGLGQDAGWDLRNYHYYNAHAWVTGRYAIDIAPAQQQTWHYPLFDLVYYFLARSGWTSGIATAMLCLPAAAGLFFLAKVADMVAPEIARGVPLLVLIVLGATGAAAGPWIGTTISEWHVVAPLLAALWLVLGLVRTVEHESRRILFAGLLGGAAVGLKLTAAVYTLGLAAVLLTLPAAWDQRLRRLVTLGLGGALAFAVVYGPWAWFLQQTHGNPFFPYWNDVFRSPDLFAESQTDRRFIADTAEKIATLPWKLMKKSTFLVSETTLRDWRLGVGLLALVVLMLQTRTLPAPVRIGTRALPIFFVVSFVLWAMLHGIYRYAVVLELIAALAILVCLVRLHLRHTTIVCVVAGLVIGLAVKWPQVERLPHGVPTVLVSLPTLPENSLVVFASQHPFGYLAANLPSAVPVVSVYANFLRVDPPRTRLQLAALERVRRHAGPRWLLINQPDGAEWRSISQKLGELLAEASVSVDLSQCRRFNTPLERDLALCSLVPSPAREGMTPSAQPAQIAPRHLARVAADGASATGPMRAIR